MLTGESTRVAHALQNIQLLLLSFCLLPLSTSLLFYSYTIGKLIHRSGRAHRKHVRSPHTSYFEAKTVLVTGVGMTKGLSLARLFFTAGHRVIGADFESSMLPTTCGRFSRSLDRFYKLNKPDGSQEKSARYAQDLLKIVQKENIDLWVSCSGVASAVDDGVAKQMIELTTSCKSIQFDVAMTKKLHEKHSFVDLTRSFGLSVPDTHHITSREAALRILAASRKDGTKYIMKYTGTDDTVRGDMTLLPFPSPAKTTAHISKLSISNDRPWILQQFVSGPEFCTHALVVDNIVRAFVSCPSAELLMHYTALPQDSPLAQSMLRFTEEFAEACHPGFTGHLSFDFLVKQADYDNAVRGQIKHVPLWPIECNPRAHTAVVLFADTPEMIDQGYMSVFDPPSSPEVDRQGQRRLNGHKSTQPVYPRDPRNYYWIPHDLIELTILPILSLAKIDGTSFTGFFDHVTTFAKHIVYWRDGTFEVWDPLPAWWLWHVSWPCVFLKAIFTGSRWSRINVSTMKVFGC